MALDRIWTLFDSETNAAANAGGEPVWLQFAPVSSLVSLPSVLGPRVPLQTVTVRMRYRSDLSLASVLKDQEGNDWFVQQILEVGRRKWLDVSVLTYPPAPAEPPAATWPPAADSGAQQDGYTLGYRELFVSGFTRRTTEVVSGQSVTAWLSVQCTNPNNQSGVIPRRLILGARNAQMGNVWFDCYAYLDEPSSLSGVGREAQSGFMISADDATFPDNSTRWWHWNAYSSQNPALTVGQRVYVLTAAEVAALPRGAV